MLPTKFRFIYPGDFRGEDLFKNQPIRNKNCLWWPCLLTDWDEMGKFNRGPSIDASYQIASFGSFAQAIFLKIDQSETRIACGGHVCKWIGAK
jgi:hypothetical protein